MYLGLFKSTAAPHDVGPSDAHAGVLRGRSRRLRFETCGLTTQEGAPALHILMKKPTQNLRSFASRVVPCLLLGGLASCVASIETYDSRDSKAHDGAGNQDGGSAKEHAKADKLRGLQHKAEAAEAAVHNAHMSLDLAAIGERLAQETRNEALRAAEVALAQATEKVTRFRELQRAEEEEVARMALDRAAERLIGAQQDLQGILDIYEQEEEARSRDEIIRRHRMSVVFAERGQALSAARLEMLLEHEFPAKELVLEETRIRAEQALEGLRRQEERIELEREQKQHKLHVALVSAEHALEDAQIQLDRALRKAGEEGRHHASEHEHGDNEEHGDDEEHGHSEEQSSEHEGS